MTSQKRRRCLIAVPKDKLRSISMANTLDIVSFILTLASFALAIPLLFTVTTIEEKTIALGFLIIPISAVLMPLGYSILLTLQIFTSSEIICEDHVEDREEYDR